MTHLTTAQILQTVDGTADYAMQTAVTSHLAVCPRCRAEVEFHRSLLRTARRMPLARVSDRFTKTLMARIMHRKQHPGAVWILNNMGNMFAMMAVLGTLWLVLANAGALVRTFQDSPQDGIVQQWQIGLREGYAQLTDALRSVAPRPEQANASNGSHGTTQKLLLSIVSIGLLALIDRFWSSKIGPRAKG